jgi:hypothetical protein
MLKAGKIIIYPIITYNDFQFGLTGLNVYLQQALRAMLKPECAAKLTIMPVILMNLESLLDTVFTRQGIPSLEANIFSIIDCVNHYEELAKVTRKSGGYPGSAFRF